MSDVKLDHYTVVFGTDPRTRDKSVFRVLLEVVDRLDILEGRGDADARFLDWLGADAARFEMVHDEMLNQRCSIRDAIRRLMATTR